LKVAFSLFNNYTLALNRGRSLVLWRLLSLYLLRLPSNSDPIQIALLSKQETRFVAELQSRIKSGHQLEEVLLTICRGTDMVNINYTHCLCPDPTTAKVTVDHSSLTVGRFQ
jgi:hypothetical protein